MPWEDSNFLLRLTMMWRWFRARMCSCLPIFPVWGFFEGLEGVDITDGSPISQEYGYESGFMAYLSEVGYEFLVLGPG